MSFRIYATCQARVQLANPYVEGGAELDRQVATLAGADGRSRGDEAAILQASRKQLVR
jgi:hypothetical protein